MYSFSQRDDTKVVDEPFYAHYLEECGVEHPGRDKILASQPTNPREVLEALLEGNTCSKNLMFIKNMAHHITGMENEMDILLEKFEHVFLIRDPGDMLPSLAENLPNPTLRDTAYKREFELFQMVKEQVGIPHVIDARELLKNPRQVLSELCERLNIPFMDNMLTWKKGPIPEDGVWAGDWYHNVHKSTGFEPYEYKDKSMPEQLKLLYHECLPYYRQLYEYAIKITA